MFKLTRFSIVLAVLVLSFALAVPTFACSPSRNPSDFTIEDRIDNAPIVLVGEVVDGTTSWGTTIAIAEVEVENYLKGEGLAVVNIAGFGDGPDCLSRVAVGQRYIFFAADEGGEMLNAVYLVAQDAAWHADDETISTITAYTGQSNEPMPLPFATQVQRAAKKYAPFGIGVLALLGVMGGAVAFKRRNGRKPKAKRGE